MPLVLTREDVISVLDMKECMNSVEMAFAELTNGTAVLPLRIGITPPDGLALYMPAYLKEMKALACKIVSVYSGNPVKHNMPTTIGKVLLQDPETGNVICIMDGGYLTAVRTGAASGVATRYLAAKKEHVVAGIFGAGVQAKMQLWAIAEAVQLDRAFVFDISDEAMNRFTEEMSAKLNIEVRKAASAAEIVAECDVICTATSAANPLFDGATVKAGTHINGIGSHTPGARELDTAIISRSRFIGDSRDACFSEAGDILIPIKEGAISDAHFFGELGELITGKKTGRGAEEKELITIFKSNGLAIQDVATAKLVYEKALQKGIGTEISI